MEAAQLALQKALQSAQQALDEQGKAWQQRANEIEQHWQQRLAEEQARNARTEQNLHSTAQWLADQSEERHRAQRKQALEEAHSQAAQNKREADHWRAKCERLMAGQPNDTRDSKRSSRAIARPDSNGELATPAAAQTAAELLGLSTDQRVQRLQSELESLRNEKALWLQQRDQLVQQTKKLAAAYDENMRQQLQQTRQASDCITLHCKRL